MAYQVGVIRLRSTLSISDDKLQPACAAYLSRLNPREELSFVKPKKGIMNVFFIQTGGSEIYFKDIYQNYPEPYIILARKENNSLAASLEIVAFLQGQNKKAFLFFGEEEEVGAKLVRFAMYFEAKKKLSKVRLGVIGKPSDWLIASDVDPIMLKKKWGITLVQVPYKKLIAEINKNGIDEASSAYGLGKKTRRKEDLRFSLFIHNALKNLAKEYRLDGFTLRCFDLVMKYQQTACLGFGMLNDEGILAGCEGDVPSLLSMLFAKALFDEPAFMANPANLDPINNKATYAHCTIPIKMTQDYRLDTHFESDHGFGIAGTMRQEEITCFKIRPDLGALMALEGKIVGTPNNRNMCRTQIDVAFVDPVRQIIEHPHGNHMIFIYGSHKQELMEFFEYLG